KQFEDNVQTYLEVVVYGVASFANILFTPPRDKVDDKEDAVERAVQKALTPIVETLRKIAEKSDRSTNMFHGRPNYAFDNRKRNIGNRNNNVNNSPCCYACGRQDI